MRERTSEASSVPGPSVPSTGDMNGRSFALAKQRDVVANVLRYLENRWNMKDAGELLRNWRAS